MLYLVIACLAVGVYFALASGGRPQEHGYGSRTEEILVNAAFALIEGGAFCAPGAAVWLLAISRYPPSWSPQRRRMVAVATTPVIGAYWILLFGFGDADLRSWWFALLFGIVLPLGSGFVVRWRRDTGPKRRATGRPRPARW
jgi:hypothetical protein